MGGVEEVEAQDGAAEDQVKGGWFWGVQAFENEQNSSWDK